MDPETRSIGVTIFSVIEIILGVAGIIAGTYYLIQGIMMYSSGSYNESTGFAFMFAAGGYILGSVMLAGGILMFSLKPAGRIINICLTVLLLPTSVFFLIYLFMPHVRRQFKKEAA